MNIRRRSLWRLTPLIVIVSLMGTLIAPATAFADISGTTYTSNRFGFTITWDASWFVVQELEGQTDGVLITNGLSLIAVEGGEFPVPLPEAGLAMLLMQMRLDPSFGGDVTPKIDASGNLMRGDEGDRSWMVVDVSMTIEGTTLDFTGYLESRAMIEGVSLINTIVLTPSWAYESEWPGIQQILNSMTVPGQEQATNQAAEPAEPAAPLAGEPRPVFVSGPWRVAVRLAAENRAFADLRLSEKDGKEWLVVVADVTNWSSTPATFNARDFFLRPGQDAELVKAAPNSTSAVAKQLAVEPVAEDLTVAFAPDETKRVVLVYSIPARSREIALVHETEALPLADALEVSIDPAELPQAAVPPTVELGTFVSASDGKTFRVTLEDAGKSTRMLLLGVEPPAEGDCFDKEAEKVLDDLANTQVLIETDSALVDGKTPARYVWLINDDGTRTLLNEQLVSDGLAAAERLPVDARFGAWIRESERAAERSGNGLWGSCEAPDRPGVDETDAASTTFEIVMVDISYTQKELVVPANTEITINLVNNGAAVHNFTIDELDVESADYLSGQTGSVTFNTGAPGEYEYYCSIPGHREAGMVGTLIVVE